MGKSEAFERFSLVAGGCNVGDQVNHTGTAKPRGKKNG